MMANQFSKQLDNARMSPKNMKPGHHKFLLSPSDPSKRGISEGNREPFQSQITKQVFSAQQQSQLYSQCDKGARQGLSFMIPEMATNQKNMGTLNMHSNMEIEVEENIQVDYIQTNILTVLQKLGRVTKQDPFATLVGDDTLRKVNLTQLQNQRVVKADAMRTRIEDLKQVGNYKEIVQNLEIENVEDDADSSKWIAKDIECLLTYFTISKNTTYKQGFNELLGPFLWLALKTKIELPRVNEDQLAMLPENWKSIIEQPLSLAYSAFEMFTSKFLPTLIQDNDFICLQSCFQLLRLLLKYHDPQIWNVLSSAVVTPELFASPWFFTYFASKCDKIELIIHFWDLLLSQLLEERVSPKFIFAFSTAIIVCNRQLILCSDNSELPVLMSQMSLTSLQQLNKLFDEGKRLQINTPISFWESDEMNLIFGDNSTDILRILSPDQKQQIHLTLELTPCIQIMPSEFFVNVFPGDIACANPLCFRFQQICQELLSERSQDQGMFQKRLEAVPSGILISNQELSRSKEQQEDKYIFGPKHLVNLQSQGIHQQKSPFKTMVKQKPIQADASVVPMETETNIKDDEADQGITMKKTNSFQLIESGAEGANQPKKIQMSIQSLQIQSSREQGTLHEYYTNLGIDPSKIGRDSELPHGPSIVKLCKHCKNGTSRANNLRLIIIDCRTQILQNQGILPSTGKLNIENFCYKQGIFEQLRQLTQEKGQNHICLLGLSETQDQDLQSLSHSPLKNTEGKNLSIKEFHEKLLMTIMNILQKERVKYVSYLPGGFESCHEFISSYNSFQLKIAQKNELPIFLEMCLPHDPNDCYHCYEAAENSTNVSTRTLQSTPSIIEPPQQKINASAKVDQRMRFDTGRQVSGDFQLIEGFQNIISNRSQFPDSFDSQSNRQFGSASQKSKYSIPFQIITSTQDQSEHGQQQTQGFDIFSGFKSWFEDNIVNNKSLRGGFGLMEEGSSQQMDPSQGFVVQIENGQTIEMKNVTQQTRNTMKKTQQQNEIPSRQDQYQNNQIQHYQRNSGHNFSDREFQFPAERQMINRTTQGSFYQPQLQMQQRQNNSGFSPKENQMRMTADFPNQLVNVNQHQDDYQERFSLQLKPQIQDIKNQQTKQAINPPLQLEIQEKKRSSFKVTERLPRQTEVEEIKETRSSGSHQRKNEAVEDSQQLCQTPQIDQKDNDLRESENRQSNTSTVNMNDLTKLRTEDEDVKRESQKSTNMQERESEVGPLGDPVDNSEFNRSIPSSMASTARSELMLEERSYYFCNGIQKQQSYLPQIQKVRQIIMVDAVQQPENVVVYHIKRLASSHLQQGIQQQQLQLTKEQKNEFQNEPQVFGHQAKNNPAVTTIIITQYTTICLCQAFGRIQSRFFMHDLIKITSRKSSAKIITFYFRIPQFKEYNIQYYKPLEEEESVILDTYNQEPVVDYQFAYKRKKFMEIKMGFEFKNEEDARNCIERVSILYKRLKASKGGGGGGLQ